MSVAFDGEAVVTGSGNAVTSITAPGKTAAGANRCAVIKIAVVTFGDIQSVTYGGNAATQVAKSGPGFAGDRMVAEYVYVNPPTGATNVQVDFTGNTWGSVVVESYNGVDQTTPTSDAQVNSGTGTSASVDLTSAVGEVVSDVVAVLNDRTIAATAGQTETYNVTGGGSAPSQGAGYKNGVAGSNTLSWSISLSDSWRMAAISLMASSGGTTTTTTTAPAGSPHRFIGPNWSLAQEPWGIK